MQCMKSVHNPNAGKYKPKELRYLDTFHTLMCLIDYNRLNKLNDIYYISVVCQWTLPASINSF